MQKNLKLLTMCSFWTCMHWKEVVKYISEHIDNDNDIVLKLTDQSVDISDQPVNKNQNYGEKKF